jgi:hypothetical protein
MQNYFPIKHPEAWHEQLVKVHIPGNGYFDKLFVLTIEPKRL